MARSPQSLSIFRSCAMPAPYVVGWQPTQVHHLAPRLRFLRFIYRLSGEVKALLARPENWEKVYAVGYRNCSFDAEGELPPRTEEFVRKLQGKVALHDT